MFHKTASVRNAIPDLEKYLVGCSVSRVTVFPLRDSNNLIYYVLLLELMSMSNTLYA